MCCFCLYLILRTRCSVCVVIVCGTDSFPCIQALTQQMVPESGQFHISAASFASLLLERHLALTEHNESASSACWWMHRETTHTHTHAHTHTHTHTQNLKNWHMHTIFQLVSCHSYVLMMDITVWIDWFIQCCSVTVISLYEKGEVCFFFVFFCTKVVIITIGRHGNPIWSFIHILSFSKIDILVDFLDSRPPVNRERVGDLSAI